MYLSIETTGLLRQFECVDCGGEGYKFKAICRRCESIRKEAKNQVAKVKRTKWRSENLQRYLLDSAQRRARKRGIPFDLSIEDIAIPDRCPVFGTPFEFATSRVSANSPSVDRVIPALGYVRGNVRVISHRANTLKSDASLEELRAVVAYLERHEPG